MTVYRNHLKLVVKLPSSMRLSRFARSYVTQPFWSVILYGLRHWQVFGCQSSRFSLGRGSTRPLGLVCTGAMRKQFFPSSPVPRDNKILLFRDDRQKKGQPCLKHLLVKHLAGEHHMSLLSLLFGHFLCLRFCHLFDLLCVLLFLCTAKFRYRI